MNGDVRKLLLKAVQEERLIEALVNKQANRNVKHKLQELEKDGDGGSGSDAGGISQGRTRVPETTQTRGRPQTRGRNRPNPRTKITA